MSVNRYTKMHNELTSESRISSRIDNKHFEVGRVVGVWDGIASLLKCGEMVQFGASRVEMKGIALNLEPEIVRVGVKKADLTAQYIN